MFQLKFHHFGDCTMVRVRAESGEAALAAVLREAAQLGPWTRFPLAHPETTVVIRHL